MGRFWILRHCKQCQLQSKLDKNSKEYQDFKEKHIGCKASYRVSAPAMEPEGAVHMFSRSIEKHGLYHTKFYGDGDSKSYLSVKIFTSQLDRSQESLLRKCLYGKTQNQNESFNRVIWDRIPRSTYVGSDVFELRFYDAAAHFNEGSIATCLVLERLGLPQGFFTDELYQELDVSRIDAAEYQLKESTKFSELWRVLATALVRGVCGGKLNLSH
eukprot:gene5796-11088_t